MSSGSSGGTSGRRLHSPPWRAVATNNLALQRKPNSALSLLFASIHSSQHVLSCFIRRAKYCPGHDAILTRIISRTRRIANAKQADGPSAKIPCYRSTVSRAILIKIALEMGDALRVVCTPCTLANTQCPAYAKSLVTDLRVDLDPASSRHLERWLSRSRLPFTSIRLPHQTARGDC